MYQKLFHSLKVSIYATMWSRGIIGRYFLKIKGYVRAVNSEHYVVMLDDFLLAELQNIPAYN